MKLQPLHHVGIALALFVGVVIVYIVFLNQIEHMRVKAFETGRKLITSGDTLLVLSENKSQKSPLEIKQLELQKHFVTLDGIVTYIESLETMARNRGVGLTVESVDTRDNEDPTLVLSVRIEGAFSRVMEILADIEYGEIDAHLSQVTFERMNDQWLLVGMLEARMR